MGDRSQFSPLLGIFTARPKQAQVVENFYEMGAFCVSTYVISRRIQVGYEIFMPFGVSSTENTKSLDLR